MIKDAIFCNICGTHVYENTSIALHMIHGPCPTVDMRNTHEDERTQPSDIVFCLNCELDIYAILVNNHTKRVINDNETG